MDREELQELKDKAMYGELSEDEAQYLSILRNRKRGRPKKNRNPE